MLSQKMLDVLDKDGLTPDSTLDLARIAENGFAQNKGFSTYIARSLFRDLRRRWDDTQAIPTSEFDRFQPLVPALKVWLKDDQSFRDTNAIEAVLDSLPPAKRIKKEVGQAPTPALR